MSETPPVSWQFDAPDIGERLEWLTAAARSSGLTVTEVNLESRHDVFLDTPDGRLADAGRVLRIALAETSAEASVEALHRTTNRAASLCEQLPDTAIAAPLSAPGAVGQRLRTLCGSRPLRVLREERTESQRYRVRLGDYEAGEVRFDAVEVLREDGFPIERCHTAKVTSKPDAIAIVAPFVGALRAAGGLTPLRTSDATHSEDVSEEALPPTARAPSIRRKSRHHATVGGFVAQQLRGVRRELAASEPGVRLGEDPRAPRQMMLTARRAEALLELFDAHLPRFSRTRIVRRALAQLAYALEAIEGVDERRLWLRSRLDSLAGDVNIAAADLAPLEALLAQRRTEAQASVVEVLDSRMYGVLLGDLAILADLADDQFPTRLCDVAPRLIEARHRRLKRAGRRIRAKASVAELRSLGLEAARMRFAAELLATEYRRPARELAAEAQRLEERVAVHRAAAASITSLRALASSVDAALPPTTVFAMGVLAEQERARARTARPRFRAEVRRLGRKSWPRLVQRMRCARGRGTPVPHRVFQAHALGPGATSLPGDETSQAQDHDLRPLAVPEESLSLAALGEAVEAAVPAASSRPESAGAAPSSPARRLQNGTPGLLG